MNHNSMHDSLNPSLSELFSSAKKIIDERKAVRVLLVSIFLFSLFSWYFLLDTYSSIDDQFFNIKIAQLAYEEGYQAFQNFHWFAYALPQPWISNLLFYYTLIPFTFFSPLEIGIKVFAVSGLTFTFTVLYCFFLVLKIERPFFWLLFSLAFLMPHFFFWKLLGARAFVLAPALLMLQLIFLKKKKYVAAALISGAYFFWHTGTFFFPLIIAGTYFLVETFIHRKSDVRSLYSFLGILGAFLLSLLCIPGFYGALKSILHTIVTIILTTSLSGHGVAIDEGMEVYPIDLFGLYGHAPILIALVTFFTVFCAIHFFRVLFRREDREKLDPFMITLFFLTSLFLLGCFITNRFSSFFGFFALLFVVYSLHQLLPKNFFERFSPSLRFGAYAMVIVAILSSQLLIIGTVGGAKNHTLVRGAAQWLEEKTVKNEIVYTPTINMFPTFFLYNNAHNRVIIGSEPRNFYENDSRRYWLWYNFSNKGVVCEERECTEKLPVEGNEEEKEKALVWYKTEGEKAKSMIQEEFQSRYILTSKEFPVMNTVLENSPAFRKVFTGVHDYYTVYEVVSP